MKKFVGVFLVILSLLMAGCGAPSPKEEAKALNEKYLGEKGAFTVVWENRKTDAQLGSQEAYEHISKLNKQWTDVENQLANEKVSKEVEPLKNAMLAQSKNISDMYGLLLSAHKAIIEKKNNPKFANVDKGELMLAVTIENPELMKKLRVHTDIFWDEFAQKKYERLNEYNKITEGKPLPIMGINGKNYRAYSASNVLLAVTKCETKQQIGSNPYTSKKALGKFIVVSVFVKNNQKDAITVDSASFKLIDNQKREFTTSSGGQFAMQVESGTTKGTLTQLNPGMGTEFTFVFDVPAEMNLNDFKLQGTGGFSGDKIVMDIQPWIIKTVKN